METPWQRFLPPLGFGHLWHANQLPRLLRACRYVSLIKSLFALALFIASGIDRIPFSVCPKRLDAGQTTKQHNRAKCGIPRTQTTSKGRPLFAAVQSVRCVRGGGFERSEALTFYLFHPGLCIVERKLMSPSHKHIHIHMHVGGSRSESRTGLCGSI